MEKVSILGVEKYDDEGAILRLSVRGHDVEAVFTARDNQQIFSKIRNILLQSCVPELLGQKQGPGSTV